MRESEIYASELRINAATARRQLLWGAELMFAVLLLLALVVI